MIINVAVDSHMFRIPVGKGENNIRWLAMVSVIRVAREVHPHEFRLPSAVTRKADGLLLRPKWKISAYLRDGDTLIITTHLAEGSVCTAWGAGAYGEHAHLCETPIVWHGSRDIIPSAIVGTCTADPVHARTYRVLPHAVSTFSTTVEATPGPGGEYSWVAYLRSPPGVAKYKFVDGKGKAVSDEYNVTIAADRLSDS
jgi:hypothetical protein